VTVKPLKPLSQFDQARIRQGNTWALYETMPADGHEWFTVDPDGKPNWNEPASESAVFGQIDETAVRATLEWPRLQPQAFPNAESEFQAATNRLNALLASYLRDATAVPRSRRLPPV
jgi:hypothetical protein